VPIFRAFPSRAFADSPENPLFIEETGRQPRNRGDDGEAQEKRRQAAPDRPDALAGLTRPMAQAAQ